MNYGSERLRSGGDETKKGPQLTPIENLRAQCMARGAKGIRGLARTFKIYDDDGSRTLSQEEFNKGLQDYGVKLSQADQDQIFMDLDEDDSGNINFEEFLAAVRPPMSQRRVNLIQQAFDKLDATGDGMVTVDDLKGIYNVKNHPKYKNGEWTEDRCLEEFLKSFEDSKEQDGKVTIDEFMGYYENVSHSIDSDSYFDLMMRNSWSI